MTSPSGRSADPPLTAITNVTLFDGTLGDPLHDATVIFGERIADVGASSSTDIPNDCRVVDGRGKTVIPGLIDMHVHLEPGCFGLFLAHGVTTVKDVGNQLDHVLRWREAERAGDFPSPRLHICGPLFDGDPPVWPAISRPLADPQTAVAAVDELAGLGVDALKLYMRLPDQLFGPVIDRAHELDLPVTAHLGGVSATAAVAAGLDGIEHVVQGLYNDVVRPRLRLEAHDRVRLGQSRFWAQFLAGWADADLESDAAQRAIDLLVKSGTFIVCTLAAHGFKLGPSYVADRVELTNVPDRLTSKWPELVGWFTETWSSRDFDVARDALAKARSFVGAFHRAGGTILAGTDSPFPYLVPGAALHLELDLLGESGLNPAEALRAATSAAARALGRSDDLGTVEPGKLADLLLLRRNPLSDTSASTAIQTVFKGGISFDPADLVGASFAELDADHPAMQIAGGTQADSSIKRPDR